jgi:putative endopeptidase
MMKNASVKTFRLLMAAAVISGGLHGCREAAPRSTLRDPIDLSARDTSVHPGDNFYTYANGTWLKNTRIPADEPGWGGPISMIERVTGQIKSILDSCLTLKDLPEGGPARQVRDLYASALDSTSINKAGLSPLRKDLDRINAIKNPEDIIDEMAQENVDGDWWWNWYANAWGWCNVVTGSGQLCALYAFADDKNSDVVRLQCAQGGLGLPNRTYYFRDDSAGRHISDLYKAYISKILSLIGDSAHADADAGNIYALEKKLAGASVKPVDLYDPEPNYHLMSVGEALHLAPNIDWRRLLTKMGVQTDTLIIKQPAFYRSLSGLLTSEPVSVWKKYLSFHLVSHYATWLSRPFQDASFTFNQSFSGMKVQRPRWKLASRLVDWSMGDALGRLYVERYFPASYKTDIEELVGNLKTAFAKHIRDVDWMSDSTKTMALAKLDAMVVKIGYPDRWKDYSSVTISPDSLIRNLKQIGGWYYRYDMAKLHHPVVRSDWYMTPVTVNAYNTPTSNDINFPAAILQPVYYFPHADDAVNYGAIGSVIGHEMTHSFDLAGSQYDKTGSLKNWWTPEDRRKFEQRAEGLIKQYDAYTVLDSIHLNGKLGAVENIADLGGLVIAYTAFQQTAEYRSDSLIDGLTPDQRFFLAFAQSQQIKIRPQLLARRVHGGAHAPDVFRVIGPLSDMTAFYKAFGVKPGDKMYRADSLRVTIW